MACCLFHLHTTHSYDGRIGLVTLRARAQALGIDTLCITDHNTIDGALEFRRRYPEVRTVVGEEVMTREGEVIGLFLEERIAPGLSLGETLAAIRAQDGLVALPHPCDAHRLSTLRPAALAEALQGADIVEVFNGRTFKRSCDRHAQTLCSKAGRIPIWGPDAHYPEELGGAWFNMPDFGDGTSFLKSLRSATPGRLRPTSLALRLRIRLRRLWGSYGPLTLPERAFLGTQRAVVRAAGGGFVDLRTVDGWCASLAAKVTRSGYRPEVVVGIAGGGLYPAFRLAEHLGVRYGSLRISYPQLRVGHLDTDDMIGAIFLRNRLVGNEPRLVERPQVDCRGRKVLLVDDDCTSGRTLRLALGALKDDATETRTVALRILAESVPRPDFFEEDRTGSLFRHPRFPWIKYAPDYPAYAAFRERWLV